MKWLERLMAWLGVETFEIGRAGLDRYLTRWTLLGRRYSPGGGKLFLHLFHRGDAEPYCHDHPWAFWSLILWGGYTEVTPGATTVVHQLSSTVQAAVTVRTEQRRWYGPLALLRRPADWRHRVELPAGRHAVTLVWTGSKSRSWGFHCPGRGFMPWRQHEANHAAGRPGCGE